jgi:hypothetical protein
MSDSKLQDDLNNIPLADDDPQVVIQDDGDNADNSNMSEMIRQRSLDSLPSSFTNGSSSPGPNSRFLCIMGKVVSVNVDKAFLLGLDPDISPDEQEEKARLISQVLELQNTLDGKQKEKNLSCLIVFGLITIKCKSLFSFRIKIYPNTS